MILKELKRRSNQIFFRKNFESFIKNSNKISPKHLDRILLIIDQSVDKEDILGSLKNHLGLNDPQFEVVVFAERQNKNEDQPNVITEKDFGWNGKIEEGYLKEILTNKFDLLINYGKVENLYLDLLVLQVRADLKVGQASLQSENYDLLIQCINDNSDVFASELKKYLEILK